MIDTFIEMIESRTNFAFSRFNDGEVLAMFGEIGRVTARGDQVIDEPLKENLIRCAEYEQENYWKGFPCSLCFPEHHKLAMKIFGEYKQKCLSTIFVNHDWQYLIKSLPEALEDREIVFVSGSDQNPSKLWFMPIITKLHVSIPNKNSWQYYDEVINNDEIKGYFKDNTIVLLSCGPLSRVLCCDWFREFPNCTFIDLGSCFDPFTRNVWHKCHLGELKQCRECNRV
jgi:hypothetical protein